MRKTYIDRRAQCALIGAAVFVSAAASVTQGAPVTWVNPGGGVWGTAANWSSSPNLPSNADTTTIDWASGSRTIDYDTDVYSGAAPNNGVGTLSTGMASGSGTLTLNIGATNFNVRSGNFTAQKTIVNVLSTGALTVNNNNLLINGGSTLTLASGGSITAGTPTLASISIAGESAGTFIMSGGAVRSKGADASNRGIAVGTAFASNNIVPGGVMTVTDGTVTNDGRLIVGTYNNYSSASVRSAYGTVSFSGGVWTNAGNVLLGFNNAAQATQPVLTNAQGNLYISGGTFTVGSGKKMYVGASAGSGTLAVSGGTLGTSASPVPEILVGTTFDLTGNGGTHGSWYTVVGNGVLNVSGGNVYTNQLIAINGSKSTVNFTGGTLHTGGTNIANGSEFAVGDGTLAAKLDLLGGSHTFTDGLRVKSNASLVGRGTINGNVTIMGGGSEGQDGAFGGVIANDSFAFSSGSTFNVELGAPTTAGVTYDQIALTGTSKTFTVGGATLQLIPMSGVVTGVPYRIVDATGGSGNIVDATTFFSGLALAGTNLGSWAGVDFTYNFDVGSNYIDVTFQTIPEPASMGLIGMSLLGVGSRRRRR